jgi:hypothetical protein
MVLSFGIVPIFFPLLPDINMNQAEINLMVKAHLPAWATKRAAGLEVGAQLPTRDGRITGNAHIVRVTAAPKGRMGLQYLVLTDGGNSFVMSESEIEAQYYPPEFVGDLQQIIKKFWREDTPLLEDLME